MENMSTIINQYLEGPLGSVLGALLIFILGWIVAKIIAGLVRKLLSRSNVNQRMNTSTGMPLDIEATGSKLVFWFIFIMAISGALNMLNISAVSEPFAKMIGQVLTFLPKFLGAAVVGVVGWIVATIARTVIAKVLSTTSLDEKLSEDADMDPISNTLADIIYGLILLVVMTMVLGKLELHGLFEPLTNMIDKIMSFIPNIILAGVVFFIGYIIAKVVRGIITNIVSAMNLQTLTTQAGISKEGGSSLPNLAGSLVFLVVIIPVTITALDALKIDVIARPATNMLNKIMDALPNIITAVAILIITYFIMRMVTNVIKSVLENTQINAIPYRVGMEGLFGESQVSDVVGTLVMFFAMLFAVIMSADILGFTQISEMIVIFIGFAANIMLGAVIMVIGFWLANLVAGFVAQSEDGSHFLSGLVRVLIMGLVIAMGLKAMDIADSIVNLAFGLTLGSVAVAFALSFGLGGQEAAARFLRKMQDKCDACEAEKAEEVAEETTTDTTTETTTSTTTTHSALNGNYDTDVNDGFKSTDL